MKTIVWFGFVLGALSATAKQIVTKPGKTATIECEFKTSSKSLAWNRGNNLICGIDGRSGFPRKGSSDTASRSRLIGTDLRISAVKEEDAGEFTCVADGRSQQHTLVVVSVSVSPSSYLQVGSEATLQCRVKGLSPEPTVQWKRPDGSPHTGSQIKSVASSDAGKWNCTFSLGGATHIESLDIKIKEPPTTPAPLPTQNSNHIPESTCPDCATDPSSGAAGAQLLLGLDWWVWVAVGVGCLVVVLLLVLVIVLSKRIRRRKRKLLKMKNGRQLQKPKLYCQCNRPTAAAKPQQGRRREKPSAPPLQPLLME